MAAEQRSSVAKLCLALGLFALAGFFRQLDRLAAPLPSAACFLLTNLIYIGLAMAWGFSDIAPNAAPKRPAMAAAGLCDGRAVAVSACGQISLFHRSYYYPAPVVSVLCAADPCAAVQPVRCAAAWAAGGRCVFPQVVSAVHSSIVVGQRHSDQ